MTRPTWRRKSVAIIVTGRGSMIDGQVELVTMPSGRQRELTGGLPL